MYVCIHLEDACVHVRRSQANLIAKSTGCKGSYALMKLPEHNRTLQTVPDAMHEKMVYLVTCSYIVIWK